MNDGVIFSSADFCCIYVGMSLMYSICHYHLPVRSSQFHLKYNIVTCLPRLVSHGAGLVPADQSRPFVLQTDASSYVMRLFYWKVGVKMNDQLNPIAGYETQLKRTIRTTVK